MKQGTKDSNSYFVNSQPGHPHPLGPLGPLGWSLYMRIPCMGIKNKDVQHISV